MKIEEITLSDDLKQPLPWKIWVKEHWGFLVVIGGLSVISLFFLTRDLFYPSPTHIEKFELEPPPPPPTPSPPQKRTSPRDPFSFTKILFQKGEIDLAISSLLKLARRHPNPKVREKAAKLAKKYHRLRTQKRELKQKYLKGYVLFNTYPKEACQTWSEILKYERPEEPYYRKAKKRFEENCVN